MKKLFSTLLLLALTVAGANAQLLYRISGNGLKKDSYVFGTFHCAGAQFAEKHPGTRQALDETSQVYGELKMADMLNPDSLQAMQKSMMLPEGKTLRTVLSAAQYARLDKVLTEYMGVGLSNPVVEQQMGRMSPAAINTQLLVLMYMKAHMGEFDPTSTIDQYFQIQAQNNNEPTGGLETVAFQTGVLFGAPMERQVAQLECTLNNTDYYTLLNERLAKAYFAQDLKALDDIMNEKFSTTCDATPEEQDRLIYNRNADWAAKMPAIMSAAPTLFVVGAGHLPGTRGLLALLVKAGYKVEAVDGDNTSSK